MERLEQGSAHAGGSFLRGGIAPFILAVVGSTAGRSGGLISVAAVLIALVSLSAVPARSAVTAQQQGAALLAQVQSGKASCGALSSGNLALGTMMGMMGNSEMGASYGSAYAAGNYGSSMMDGHGFSQTAGKSGMSGGVIAAIVLGSLALLALVILLATGWTPGRPTRPRSLV